MSVLLSGMSEEVFSVRQARALKSALSDLMSASERDGATSRDLASLYATSVMAHACANLRARAVSSVPLRLLNANNEDVPDVEPLARVIKTGMRELLKRSELTVYFWGRNLLYKQRNIFGAIVGLRWLNPTLWSPETSASAGLRGFRIYQQAQSELSGRLLALQDVVYLHLLDFADDFDGIAPAEVAFLEAGLEVEMAMTTVNFFRNRAIPALILQPAKETASEDSQAFLPEQPNVNKLTDFLRRVVRGSRNAGRTIVQPVRWEAVQLQQNFKDLAMSELYQETRRSVAIASEVPYELIVPTASTYAQIYDTRRGWYEGWVQPQVEWYCDAFTKQLATEVNSGWQIVPDFESVAAMKEDAAAKQNRVIARVQAGLLDLNTAQRELGDEPDEALSGLYVVRGMPVPREALRGLWREQALQQNAPERAHEVDALTNKLPPAPPSSSNSLPAAKDEVEQARITEVPQGVLKEIKTWAYVCARKGAAYPFVAHELPPDTAAYIRLLLTTGGSGLLSAEEVVAAGRADYLKHHLTGEKAYSETALNYRAALLNLVRSAFDELSLKRSGEPALSLQAFTEAGQAVITNTFRQAFLDGLRETGVNTDELDEDEQAELTLRTTAEQTYFSALARSLYRESLPLYLEVLALQEDARMPEASFEDRATWQRQAVEKYHDFIRARERIEARIDGYVFKGLEQIHTLGRLYGQKNKMQKWVRDPAKDSCRSCLALDGQVHRAREFLKYVIPQDSKLLCHGDRCGCKLVDTTERATRNKRLDRVPLNRSRKSAQEFLSVRAGAMALKTTEAGAIDVGFYVSFAGDAALVKLRHWVAEALNDITNVTWQDSLELHLSLAYAAEPQPPPVVAQLIEALDQKFANKLAFNVSISGVEVWPTAGRAALEGAGNEKVLVATVKHTDELRDLIDAAVNVLREQGIQVSDFSLAENYRAHITLARGEDLPNALNASIIEHMEHTQVRVDNVCLATPDSIITAVPLLHEHDEE